MFAFFADNFRFIHLENVKCGYNSKVGSETVSKLFLLIQSEILCSICGKVGVTLPLIEATLWRRREDEMLGFNCPASTGG